MNELSRQNSIQSSHHGEISVVRPSVMERMGSARSTRSGSYGRDVGSTRWGGYSPGGNVTSPLGSVSGSWSHASLSRVTSGSKSSRLAQVSEPMLEGRPLDSPLRPSFGVNEFEHEDPRQVSDSSFGQRYDEIAGQIESSLEHVPPSPPKHNASLPERGHSQHLNVEEIPDRPRSTDTFREAEIAFKDFDGVHFSPDTNEIVEIDEEGREVRRVSARNSSGGLSWEAASLLRTPRASQLPPPEPPPDEGMVYYPAPVPRMLNLPKRLSQLPAASVQAKRRSQVLGQLPPEARASGPWLPQGKLNENSGVQRSGSRHSRGSSGALPKPFLSERMSDNVSNLPPQLRANMFFEHQPIQQDIEIKSESAVATLDSILEASATAPVHAFVDHPYAGDVRKSVYSAERTARRSTNSAAPGSPESQKKTKKRRSSGFGALLKRASSSDELTRTSKKNGSRTSLLTDLGNMKLKKRKSQMSLGDDLDREQEAVRTPGDHLNEHDLQSGLLPSPQNASSPNDERRLSRPATALSVRFEDTEQVQDGAKDEEEDEDLDGGEPTFVQPSTLLAELQVRKAQQKSRSKTAATAFPNGMHSTLLQLDAVEEISKRKRKQQRIALAWEDPHQRALEADLDQDDEDVPLGMLFPGKDGKNHRQVGDGRDWDRPMGLMEKREMEDNEPLASRRNRLRGESPSKGRAPSPDKRLGVLPNGSQLHLAGQPDASPILEQGDDEGEGETLAQRLKLMKTKEALDTAISDVAPKEGERPTSTFTDDVMSQFGGLDVKDQEKDTDLGAQKKPAASPDLGPEEEETLGQRRARLQREREASGEQRNVSDGSNRPPLRSSSSYANLLAANPVGPRPSAKEHDPAQGTLLHASAQLQAKQKNQLANTNMRSSSYHLEKPLVDSRPRTSGEANSRGLLAYQAGPRAPSGGFAAGTYNNGMGGIQPLQTSASTPGLGLTGANGYFPSPTAGMPYAGGYGNGMMGYPQQMQMPQMQMQMGVQQQSPYSYQPMNPVAYGANPGLGLMGNGFMGNAYNPGMMGGTYAGFAQQGGMNGMAMNPAGMAMPMGMNMEQMEAELPPQQRAAIDRWRMSIAHQ